MKPEFNSNESLSALSCQAHLMAEALLGYADDEGYFNANPQLIRAGTCPLREDFRNISGILQELSGVDYIRLGSANGKRYGRIVKFLNHQKISHPSRSKIKPLEIKWDLIPENSRTIPEYSGETPEPSAKTPEILRPDQGSGNRDQGTGNGEQGSGIRELSEGTKNVPSSSDEKLSDAVDPVQILEEMDEAEELEIETPSGVSATAEQVGTGKKNLSRLMAVKNVFAYYCSEERMNRDSRVYTLTPLRLRKGLARLDDALRKTHGDLERAQKLMEIVVDEVYFDDFLMGRDARSDGKRYCEWEDHLFKSTDLFEKRLQQSQDAAEWEEKHG